MWLLKVKQHKYFVLSLRHKVVTMWLHGANFKDCQFTVCDARKIIEFLQTSYPKYLHFDTTKSFVYQVIDHFRDTDVMPSDDLDLLHNL